jgi:hypothetical protein
MEEIIALYKEGIDITLIRENLKLSPTERLRKLESFMRFVDEVRRAGAARRRR